MTDPIRPDFYADLIAKHGDRMPPEAEAFIRPGWVPLIDRLMTDLAREYPDVRILGLVAGGWLQVDFALPSGGNHDWVRHINFDKWLQRYITESLSTCECCGSGFGNMRGDHLILCDSCEKEPTDAHG